MALRALLFAYSMNIEQLFFELIRVAIGTQDTLTRAPSAQEWKALYDMAKKQSLVGVCFAALQRLGSLVEPLEQRNIEPFEHLQTHWNLPEMLYLTWMGMAAKIQQRNEVVNGQCVELQRMLANDGFQSCILKGQGVAMVYPEHLRGLRQLGDIDVWAMPKEAVSDGRMVMKAEERRKRICECCMRLDSQYDRTKEGKLHTSVKVFPDTDVEWHFTPSFMSSPSANKRLQKWFDEQWMECVKTNEERKTKDVNLDLNANVNDNLNLNANSSINYGSTKLTTSAPSTINLQTPSVEFNLVYLLHHIFRHYLYEGVGLRQVMDYYFVLQAYYEERRTKNEGRKTVFRDSFVNNSSLVEDDSLRLIKRLGMEKFAGALMWVIAHVFGNKDNGSDKLTNRDKNENHKPSSLNLLCEPDEKRGRRLLEVIMEGGNFGHSTEKYKITGWDRPWSRLSRYVRRNWYMLRDYPDEIIWNMIKKLR